MSQTIGNNKTYYIDTDLRHNKATNTSNNFEYKIIIPSTHTHISLSQISIPKSFYLIQSGKNTFILEEDGTQFEISVSIGNYSASQFASNVQNQLNATGNYTYAVSLNTNTGKFTFTVSDNGAVQPKLIMNSAIYKLFGFEDGSTNTFVANTIDSTNVINFQTTSLYLLSNLVKGSRNEIGDSILHEIFTQNNEDFAHIGFINNDLINTGKPINNKLNDTFNFRLVDTNQNEINLNGNELVFSLISFKKNNYDEVKKELDILNLQNQMDKLKNSSV